MSKTEKKQAKRGRPPTERGPYEWLPPRQLGRMSDQDWETLKAAARKEGMAFSHWAIGVLMREATKAK
jgi:hypothetical protein